MITKKKLPKLYFEKNIAKPKIHSSLTPRVRKLKNIQTNSQKSIRKMIYSEMEENIINDDKDKGKNDQMLLDKSVGPSDSILNDFTHEAAPPRVNFDSNSPVYAKKPPIHTIKSRISCKKANPKLLSYLCSSIYSPKMEFRVLILGKKI